MYFYTKFYNFVMICAIFNTADAVISTSVTFPGYRKWSPFNSTRNDMYCPENCYNNPEEDERCCSCDAVTCWDLDPVACNVTVGQLYVEYLDIYGSAIFVPSGNHTLFEAIHRNGRLKKFPINLCDFSGSLVKLDLSYNRIENISDIRCLTNLDTLRLDSNRITELSNETFSDMEFLRIVSLSRNNIETLHPNTNQKKNGNILMADFSFNIIEIIDVTNMIRPGPFCNVSFEGCEFTEQTNLLNYVIDENNIHGPGSINFQNTSEKNFPNFTSLGVNDYTQLGQYFKGRFEYEGSSLECDCKLYPFFTGLGKDAAKYWPRLDYADVICMSPEHMKGKNLSNMYHSQEFEDLICDLPNCPQNCICTDQPRDNMVNVKCTDKTSFPEFSPIGYWNNDRIHLDLSDPSNKISHFPNREYMNRLATVNLGGNEIQTLDFNAMESLGNDVQVNLSNQKLKTLPLSFYDLNPNSITFGPQPVDCNCDNLWIGDWIRNNQAHESLMCLTKRGVVPAEDVTFEYIDCEDGKDLPLAIPIVLSILTVSVFAITFICYLFRYELMLLKRKYIDKKLLKKVDINEFEFDAMLTFSEDNPEVFRWIERGIVPTLKEEGYSLFVPFYDVMFGGNREHEISKGVGKSRNYVIFLCNRYLCDENSVQEFEILWKHFCMDTNKNIIVVNFDNFESSEIHVRRLKAFIRIREDLNFRYREIKLFERLKRRLGPPSKYIETRNSYSTDDDEEDDAGEENGADSENDNNDEFSEGKGTDNADKNVYCNEVSADAGVQKRRKKIRKKRWYNRLAERNTTCNCKYRKCYLHGEAMFYTNVERDLMRKRAHSAQRRDLMQSSTVRPESVFFARSKSSMSEEANGSNKHSNYPE